MMIRHIIVGYHIVMMCFSIEAGAKTLAATPTTLAAVFAGAQAGDTIQLSGSFGAVSLSNRSFSSALIIDAEDAVFTDTLAIVHTQGLQIIGGRYGSSTGLLPQAVRVDGSSMISFIDPVVIGDGTTGHGIDFVGSRNVLVDGGTFTRLRAGVQLSGVVGAILRNNISLKAASDGFDVADSHYVKVLHNNCGDTEMTPGAHPDCVQLWSVAGHPRQSDIEINDNVATGPTQGFTSFNPSDGGGIRIEMLGNRVDTSFPQGIACYNCDDSTFGGNVLTTELGSQFQTQINIIGGNIDVISGNTIGAGGGHAAISDIIPYIPYGLKISMDSPHASVESAFFAENVVIATVEEPSGWTMIIAGFAMAGAALRHRRRVSAQAVVSSLSLG